ncbi:eukaryotic translation initiation factor 2-alpha kinase isoform X2 [Sitodiplosis mosellana]|uniref:eukaryotic translation initiation factor 2-alpha kinase isoform X2 n=1 Tax=Sitodiplosis mosellana TaxID=263140 RepID=UPI00244448EE|nr:eukaryotic translation initiation factor 2-alpha kinase isoform X2 [Sitodiplosis mosellana]
MRFLFEYFMLILLVILLAISYVPFASATYELPEPQQRLPFCDDDRAQQTNRNAGLLYVSTLDGKISALDILDDGQKKWTISTTPGPMISSSIQNLELTNNGQWVRMIPSLSGAIYKFDGETVEPIPVTADNLLSSSYKYSDDLVISGGKETISYGVSAQSGQIIYECSMRGCVNSTEIDADATDSGSELPPNDTASSPPQTDDEVIVVRRKTQIVRAIEPRTGEERWNFSVGQHELESIRSSGDCHLSNQNSAHDILTNLDVRVVVPDGIICAVQKNAPHEIVWKYKFDHPIVNVWKRDENNELKAVDLFKAVQGMWRFEGKSWTQSTDPSIFNNNGDEMAKITPSIYIGMFRRQLYIQESDQLRAAQVNVVNHMVGDDATETTSFKRIPWRPIDARSSSGLVQIEHESAEDTSLVTTTSSEEMRQRKKNYSATAISVLYGSEYVNGNGFYLYAKATESKCDKEKVSNDSSEDVNFGIDETNSSEDGETFRTPTLIRFISLWYWWREIILIVLSVLVFNVVLTQRKPSQPEVVVVERHVEIKVPATPEPVDNNFLLPAIEYHEKRSLSESNSSETEPEFKSRFQTDFDLLQCLGKGGFGVVFEVKNKIDDCNYAIKRIVLPKNKQSRERVMREVKTLANCEHHNIVRYFQAWVESPPPGWQEKEDQGWMDRYAMSHSIDIDSPSAEEPSKPFGWNAPPSNVRSHLYNKNKLDFVISGLQTNECVNFDDEIRKTNFSSLGKPDNDDDDDDDSFIVFAAEDNEQEEPSKATEATETSSGSDVSSDAKDENSSGLNSVFEPSGRSSTSGKVPRHRKLKTRKDLYKNLGMKKRSYSMTDSACASMKMDCEIDMSFANDACCVISEKGDDGDKEKVPFKRTHRRPLSLDLTSTGSVQIPMASIATPLVSSMSYLYIQMQLCRKQSLKDWLFENGSYVRENESHAIFKQIVEAVEYVHLKGLIHRDLKPSNIFFSLDGRIKIGDFGLVTDMSENLKSITPCGDESGLPSCAKHTQQVGTHLYMSPEQLHGRQYSYKVDIYSLGLILFELLMVFSTEMERIETIKMLRSNRFPDGFQDKFQHEYELLKLMLSKIPQERPTTYGIRARPPFLEPTDEMYHFELPPRRRDSQSFGSSLSSSASLNNSSSSNMKSSNK